VLIVLIVSVVFIVNRRSVLRGICDS
jgi:hypothetical protein